MNILINRNDLICNAQLKWDSELYLSPDVDGVLKQKGADKRIFLVRTTKLLQPDSINLLKLINRYQPIDLATEASPGRPQTASLRSVEIYTVNHLTVLIITHIVTIVNSCLQKFYNWWVKKASGFLQGRKQIRIYDSSLLRRGREKIRMIFIVTGGTLRIPDFVREAASLATRPSEYTF